MCIEISNIAVDPYVDNGKWLFMEENNVRSTLRDRSSLAFPTTWMEFPSQSIPESFNYGCIYKHRLLRPAF